EGGRMIVPRGTREAMVLARLNMRRKKGKTPRKATPSMTASSLRTADPASLRLATRAVRSRRARLYPTS
ncbi:hypothetical protein BDZ89DRAFT_969189, partial [Hymenopellis radicata]